MTTDSKDIENNFSPTRSSRVSRRGTIAIVGAGVAPDEIVIIAERDDTIIGISTCGDERSAELKFYNETFIMHLSGMPHNDDDVMLQIAEVVDRIEAYQTCFIGPDSVRTGLERSKKILQRLVEEDFRHKCGPLFRDAVKDWLSDEMAVRRTPTITFTREEAEEIKHVFWFYGKPRGSVYNKVKQFLDESKNSENFVTQANACDNQATRDALKEGDVTVVGDVTVTCSGPSGPEIARALRRELRKSQ